MQQNPRTLRHITLLGNHVPRRCGIATFTADLTDAIGAAAPGLRCDVVAMNDRASRHAYGERVRFEIPEAEHGAYRRAADFLNIGGTEVVSLQHEYGIFGGRAGSLVLELLRELRIPIVTTLHTILRKPTIDQRRVMDQIVRLSTRLVVMSRTGADLIREVHGVPASKIDIIPHGVPQPPPRPADKAALGVEGRLVILTFGLLSPDKGIEHVIQAMPSVVERHPTATYLVLGATHPHVKDQDGDAYRNSLKQLAENLGVESNVIFRDRFVSLPEIVDFLSVADIYVTPSLNPEQITSGTLAYAMGASKAIVSTHYEYARELLSDGRGILVPIGDAPAIAQAIDGLLSHPDELTALAARAGAYGRDMFWSTVGQRHLATMERAKREHAEARRGITTTRPITDRLRDGPSVNLDHLKSMTDDTGLLQHAAHAVPRYEDGYCLDDNARALLLMALLEDDGAQDPRAKDPQVSSQRAALARRYLAFVRHAFNSANGRFRNFMTYDRRWTEPVGSEDSHGRALWALGAVVGHRRPASLQRLSWELFHTALPVVANFRSARGCAYSLLGIDAYQRAFDGDREIAVLQRDLAERLLARFQEHSYPQWRWCDQHVSYDNARLAQALIVSGNRLEDAEMVDVGLESLEWLVSIQSSEEGYYSPIGSRGFYPRTGDKALFDQQPIEACAMVAACLDAWRVTRDECWAREMRRAFRWFRGENVGRASLYDETTGGCRDGLHPDRVNQNQGAESTLSFLLALTSMARLGAELRLQKTSLIRPPTRERDLAAQ